MNILDTIVKRKLEEVVARKRTASESDLLRSSAIERQGLSLSAFIIDKKKSGIIAEFKRKSPTKPNIHLHADVNKVTKAYERAGASATSILTDIDFFGGSDDDVKKARIALNIPILRKDFVIDPYQVIEAKSIGADAILLIAEILTKAEIKSLSSLAISLGMEVLMEIHSADQLKKYHETIRNIGVNNRNLKTFITDIQYSKDIYPMLPSDTVKISESGIDDPNVVLDLIKTGYQGFLIGECFMKTEDPGQCCSEFIDRINELR
ncbi:MAG: indole-3-glycerol phosphate synthase TrpC [Saprospiraceae bacterium]|nr:indole-3-glycerol phosphate synthase TrpC [Saprospiraceae bacterium]